MLILCSLGTFTCVSPLAPLCPSLMIQAAVTHYLDFESIRLPLSSSVTSCKLFDFSEISFLCLKTAYNVPHLTKLLERKIRVSIYKAVVYNRHALEIGSSLYPSLTCYVPVSLHSFAYLAVARIAHRHKVEFLESHSKHGRVEVTK
jgi:hypothetical protein